MTAASTPPSAQAPLHTPDTEALAKLVADNDTGGRRVGGLGAKVLFSLALMWALFQYWYVSPLPFALGFGVFNDTQARSIHLGFALALALLAWPVLKRSRREGLSVLDWVLVVAGAFAGGYIMLFYAELSQRPGQPTTLDLVAAGVGLLLLLEATRRAVGWPMAALAILFLSYCVLGPHMPDVLAHKGASVHRLLSHMWLTTEGVYGVALGVSTGTIFIYVLFGAMLDRAGGGNYMMQVSFAALGHLRGGPGKVAVVSSALTGMISGSSVSNVVSGGIFTIPLMKKSGYGGVKAGAIETMSSVNGQLMPPVMGAAAFLMVEYVGIPYSEVVRHAILPASLSYLGLMYIVHLEALKMGMQPVVRRETLPWQQRLSRNLLGISGSIFLVCALYYLLDFAKTALGAAAPWAVGGLLLGLYLFAIRQAAVSPDLPCDIDIHNPRPLQTWPTVRAGLHYLMPIGVLVWCLMVEEMSPAFSAFWAVTVLMVLMLTQQPLIAIMRGRAREARWGEGLHSVIYGFHDGARNMIGIGVATATAGIIVGAITLTGLGLRMTEFVEFVSQGNVLIMLLFVAGVCLVLGLGVPTTANYVLVATLMAPVVVELGARSGLVIPLIAVHLFVFYYGIMGDITPPVGLATFAASAISGESALATGIQGAMYALRTVILPFIWVFNAQLLLIDVHGPAELAIIVVASAVAMLVFAALTMGWFRVKTRWWESVVLLLAVTILFRPGFFMDRYAPEFEMAPAAKVYDIARDLPANATLVMVIGGMNLEGDEIVKTVSVQLGAHGGEGRDRLGATGLTLVTLGERVEVGNARFGSAAKRSGFEPGWEVQHVLIPTDRPSKYWMYLPGLLLVLLVWWVQGRRLPLTNAPTAPAAI